MASWQWFGRLHRAIYQMTNGKIGASLVGRPMLLLTTTGRRSGEPRTTPLSYLKDGENCVIVASNNGSDRDPAWWLNLDANPEARVTIGQTTHPVRMQRATGAELARLWPLLVDYNPQYAGYKNKTDRTIPVVILSPLSFTESPGSQSSER
jgi:deazaflavin-dependent oxidoreductase (nitroreductase family)